MCQIFSPFLAIASFKSDLQNIFEKLDGKLSGAIILLWIFRKCESFFHHFGQSERDVKETESVKYGIGEKPPNTNFSLILNFISFNGYTTSKAQWPMFDLPLPVPSSVYTHHISIAERSAAVT